MASTTTVYSLPTETIAIIAGILPMCDLRSLRLTCRWAEHEVCVDFVRRGYESKAVSLKTHNIRHFSRVLGSPKIAAAIRTLRLVSLDKIGRPKTGNTGVGRPDPLEERTKLLDLFASMPNLATLQLYHLNGPSLNRHELQSATSFSFTEFELSNTTLTTDKLCTILRAFTPNMRALKLDNINSTTGDWYSILRIIKSMQLERLDLATLAIGRGIPCLLYTSPSPRDGLLSRMPSSA